MYVKPDTFIDDGKYHAMSGVDPFPDYILDKRHPFNVYPGVGSTREWDASDSHDRYLQNLKSAPTDWKYRTKKILYSVNSSGYRTYEWDKIDWQNAIVLLGCSNTFGVGLADDETISYLLEKETGRQVVNLGFPAGSPDRMLNNSSTLIDLFGAPYAVIINWPPLTRMCYYDLHEVHNLGSWTDKSNKKMFAAWSTMFQDETNMLTRGYYVSKAIRSMFTNRSKYVTISYDQHSAHYARADNYFKLIPTARDLIHAGYENSIEVSQYINEKLK